MFMGIFILFMDLYFNILVFLKFNYCMEWLYVSFVYVFVIFKLGDFGLFFRRSILKF